MKTICCCLLLLCGLPWAGGAAEYSKRVILAGPVAVGANEVFEVLLSTPVRRSREMAQLEVEFSTGTAAGYVFTGDGISSPRGSADLVITLASDAGAKYGADLVTGEFSAGGSVLLKFTALPPRNVPLRKMRLSGRNVPPIKRISWVEGKEKLATGVDEDLSHCEEGKCGWREAADYCASRGGRLLRRAELNAMYTAECAGRDSAACRGGYWSSAEYAPFPRKAWYVDFSDGEAVAALKTYGAYVRCIVPAGAVYKSGK